MWWLIKDEMETAEAQVGRLRDAQRGEAEETVKRRHGK